jgi:hypothetical protein
VIVAAPIATSVSFQNRVNQVGLEITIMKNPIQITIP